MSWSRTGTAAAVMYAGAYAVSVLHLDRLGTYPIEEALAVLLVLGVGFSVLAWASTIGVRPQTLTVEAPGAQALLAAALTVAVTFYLVEVRTWADALVGGASSGGSELAHQAWVVGLKVLVFVVLPFAAFRAVFGTGLASFGISLASLRRLAGRDGLAVLVLGGAICVFQYFAGRAAGPFREGLYAAEALQVGLPLAFAWLAVEVGLVEEFFFRGILQQRLSAFLRSDIAGLFTMALVFGLVHAPGIVLRGAGVVEGLGPSPGVWDAAAYTVAVHSVAALFLGILWLRTRNLLAVILVHAAADLLSNAPGLMDAFGIARGA